MNPMPRLHAAAAGILLLAVGAVASPTIVNGDFENPVLTPPYQSSAAIPGWTRSGAAGDQNLIAVGFQDSNGSATMAGHGNQFATLGGGSASAGSASLSTQITGLTSGTSYLLGFMIAAQQFQAGGNIAVSFTAGSSTPARTFSVKASPGYYWLDWESKQMVFTATSSTATVVFSVTNLRYNLGLDNITVGSARAAPTSANWIRATPQTMPPVRGDMVMAYDSDLGEVVMFGGYTGANDLNDTWVWDGSNWTQQFPANKPSVRDDSAGAYDPIHHQLVVFGGYDATFGGPANDTWVWDGTNWTKLSPQTSPPARWAHRMVFDAALGKVVLFGGFSGGNYVNDMWTWDGSNWTMVTSRTLPPGRERFAMAYDAVHTQIPIFGGYDGSDTDPDDTWAWDGTNWTQKHPANSPTPRGDVLMAYDSAHGQAILFGGQEANDYNETWMWDGSNWTREAPATLPAPRHAFGMDYDAADGVIVIFGGTLKGTPTYNDTWIWNGGPLPPSPPSIDHVITAGAYGGFSAAAPGTWIEIYGNNLSATTRPWASSDFNGTNAPTMLDGVKVSIGGQAAFLDYIVASPGQINAQVPSNVGTGMQQVIVSNSYGTSQPYMLMVNATEPGLLAPSAFQIGGKQYVVALLPDGNYVLPPGAISGVASRQAKPGEVITMYGVGFGAVQPDSPAGQIVAQTNQLASALQVSFGGAPATQITYDGLAPNYVGLYQFDVTVPSVADSDLVPLTFQLGATPGTQTLYIAIHQ